EARAVLTRLGRIESLERSGAGAARLLAEMRLLLAEAEAWVRAERDAPARATAAAAALAAAVADGPARAARATRVGEGVKE
ncbi:MAG: hypothetical protein ACJ74L_03930, partial [Gaiellaceae bacterium]